MAKHYIRLDGIFITKSFSTDFEQPLETDICVNEDGGRHYNLNLYDNEYLYALKYIDGKIQKTIQTDLQPLIDAMPVPLPTIEERIKRLEENRIKDKIDIEELKKGKQDKEGT